MSVRSIAPSAPVLNSVGLSENDRSSSFLISAVFWAVGLVLAVAGAWVNRYNLSADSISYLDMSDAVMPGFSWHRLITAVWNPLYPFLLGVFRRTFRVPAADEIAFAHLVNVVCFVLVFGCFEYLLRGCLSRQRDCGIARGVVLVPLPTWAFLSIGYALFLWASLSAITVQKLRPDMLMSGFVYLALGIVVRMQRRPGRWTDYFWLGLVLGCGFLAKSIMLPMGLAIIAASLFAVENWRPAVTKAAAAAALIVIVGSIYWIPLSRDSGHLTLGETGSFNYLVYVDRVGPGWYLQDAGFSKGEFVQKPQLVFASLPTYSFAIPATITHPLRFDPAFWTSGLHPRFVAATQWKVLRWNLWLLCQLSLQLILVIAAFVVLIYFSRNRDEIASAVFHYWPLWLAGAIACCLYLLIRVEPRYLGAFLAVFWVGILLGFRCPRNVVAAASAVLTVLIVISLGVAILWTNVQDLPPLTGNVDAAAAAELNRIGLKAGDHVGRISSVVSDFGPERIARLQVAAEVDTRYASQFWALPISTQEEVLHAMSSQGVKAVIATSPPSPDQHSGWIRLGKTQYWAWLPQ